MEVSYFYQAEQGNPHACNSLSIIKPEVDTLNLATPK